MEKDRNLYRVSTRGCGEFYVVTTSFDRAEQLVEYELARQNYGFSGLRQVTDMKFVRSEHFFAGHRFFSGDDDINKLIIDDLEVREEMELRYAQRITELENRNARLLERLSKYESSDDGDQGE